MIKKRTVLVLGAGASWPYYFPLGEELVNCILRLSPSYTVRNPGYKDDGYEAWLHPSFEPAKFGQFKKDLRESFLFSIDAFLSNHSEYDVIGRAAIAATVIPCEKPVTLWETKRPHWYRYLRNQMGESFSDFQKSLDNLCIITFNYDRSLEYFFWTSLSACYGGERALDLIRQMRTRIVHVHGQLGELDFLSPSGRSYSDTLNRDTVEKAVAGIKVISDDLENSMEFETAHQFMKDAYRLCFLGFGYNETNLRRLGLSEHFHGDYVFGSAFDCEPDEVRRIENRFQWPKGSALIRHRMPKLGAKDEDALMFLRRHPVLD